MAELAIRAKYQASGLSVVRQALQLTFPFWGIICPIIALLGTGIGLFVLFTVPIPWASAEPAKFVAFLVSSAAFALIGLTVTRLISKDQLIIDKGGIRFPILPGQMDISLSYLPWSNVARLDASTIQRDKWTERYLIIYTRSGGAIKLDLDKLNPDETEQVLLAVELWSPDCEIGEDLKQVRTQIKEIAALENGMSHTDMWEEELRRRYCPTSFIPLEPGRTLKDGSLKVMRHLALGGLSAVYLCDKDDGKELVVLKEAVIPEDAQEGVKAKAKEMFEREAKFLIKLEHPGIVKVHDYFVEGGRNYLMLQYLNGQDVKQFIKQNGPQKEYIVIDWAIKIANIMKYLHEQDPPIVHRDLTPDNLVVTADGSIVVIDFGAANEFIGQATGTLVGKQSYIAPEQFRGKAVVESDIYAFGCTLYYMLTGSDPEALSTSSPKDSRDDLSHEICEFVESCTQMEVTDRYRTAAQLLPVLRRIAASQAGA